MGRKRKLRRGYVLKTDFCKEFDITITQFNEVMQEKGYLVRTLISTDLFNGNKKYALSINSNFIEPLHGSNQQGSFQYSKKFLMRVFEIENYTEIEEEPDYSKYILTFGKFKGNNLSEMNSEEQKKYLKWLHSEMVKSNDIETKKFKAIDWFVKNLDN
jgi:hypothetical protein